MNGDGTRSSNQRHHEHVRQGTTVGFFTDPTLCIGCKACEVACKEWNGVPADAIGFSGNSYDNTLALGHSTWRHVAFVEQEPSGPTHHRDGQPCGQGTRAGDGAASRAPGALQHDAGMDPLRWVFLSDVCKHCEHAGCLESCPTGSIVRTEVGSVLVQDDVCNGCGYCVVNCPFGVIDRRPASMPDGGGAFKCTFCYDRQIEGMPPACAQTCPTESIQFGALDQLHERARRRLATLHERGRDDARIYDPQGSVGGTHAFSIVIGAPEDYGQPVAPIVPTEFLRDAWTSALATAALAIVAALLVCLI